MNKTEERNLKSMHIDKMSTIEMIKLMQEENYNAIKAVDFAMDDISKAIDEISERFKIGGRLFYVGCGTSGRLGVLDASECPPTYGVSPNLVVGIIAGGEKALRTAVEKIEDLIDEGKKDLEKYNITEKDCVVGISAAGAANYVIGALNFANSKNALTISITCNKATKLEKISKISIVADTGAEVVTGSTRMKAGTAQKVILNMISTGVMIKSGYVYENLMINLKPSNIKLEERMIRIVCDLTKVDCDKSRKILVLCDWNIKKAVEFLRK